MTNKPAIDAISAIIKSLSCDDQLTIAKAVAGNIGYDLIGEDKPDYSDPRHNVHPEIPQIFGRGSRPNINPDADAVFGIKLGDIVVERARYWPAHIAQKFTVTKISHPSRADREHGFNEPLLGFKEQSGSFPASRFEVVRTLDEWNTSNHQPPSVNAITRMDVGYFKQFKEDSFGLNSMDKYQSIATKNAIYTGKGTVLGLNYCALKLNGEAGELAEHIGKAMRDENLIVCRPRPGFLDGDEIEFNDLTPERRALIIKEIGDNLWYLSAICNELGIKLSDAALANLEKLCDRNERGTLQGSGDDR